MKLLLDTHAFIWWASNRAKLSARALAACEAKGNELLLSMASLWEMQIKVGAGKLKFNRPLRDLLDNQQQQNGLAILPITMAHVWALDQLPMRRDDPFDRMLAAQAAIEQAQLVSVDRVFGAYPVQVCW